MPHLRRLRLYQILLLHSVMIPVCGMRRRSSATCYVCVASLPCPPWCPSPPPRHIDHGRSRLCCRLLVDPRSFCRDMKGFPRGSAFDAHTIMSWLSPIGRKDISRICSGYMRTIVLVSGMRTEHPPARIDQTSLEWLFLAAMLRAPSYRVKKVTIDISPQLVMTEGMINVLRHRIRNDQPGSNEIEGDGMSRCSSMKC